MADPLQSAIEPARIRERLVELVRYPSFDGYEQNVVERIGEQLRGIGAEVDVWYDDAATLAMLPGYPGHEVPRARVPVVAARLRGSRPGAAVMITGHVDVVPPGDLSQWSHDPFSGFVEGDRLFGRGSCDMKSGLVAALEVLDAFAANPDFPGQVIFVAVPGEEDSGLGTLSAIERGWRADAALLPEPTTVDGETTIVTTHAGAMGVSIFVPGKSAHASVRHLGESAFEHYLVVHEELRRDERALNEAERDPLLRELGLPYATNVGRIEGGHFISAVMDGLHVELRVGVAIDETVDDAEARIHAAVDRARARSPWLRDNPPMVTVTSHGFGSARTPRDHPLVTELVAAHEAVHGAKPRLRAVPFGCDMAGWVRRAKVPVVMYGPGDIALAHAADEHVSLDACAQVARTLTAATDRLLRSEALREIGVGGPHVVVEGGRPQRSRRAGTRRRKRSGS